MVDGADCALKVVAWLAARRATHAMRLATYRFIIVSLEPRMRHPTSALRTALFGAHLDYETKNPS